MKNLTLQKYSTILRILYPIWMIIAIFSIMYVPSRLILSEDAIITASNIASNEFIFRLGIVGSLLTQIIFIFVPLFLYKLFESVNKNQSILMVILALISVPIAMMNTLNSVAALKLLNDPVQMMFFLDLNAQGIVIVSIFWGLWLFPLGYLVCKSGYFPKIMVFLLAIAGVGYLLGSFTNLLIPHLEILLSISEVMTFGEVVFIAWFLIKGVKLQKI